MSTYIKELLLCITDILIFLVCLWFCQYICLTDFQYIPFALLYFCLSVSLFFNYFAPMDSLSFFSIYWNKVPRSSRLQAFYYFSVTCQIFYVIILTGVNSAKWFISKQIYQAHHDLQNVFFSSIHQPSNFLILYISGGS